MTKHDNYPFSLYQQELAPRIAAVPLIASENTSLFFSAKENVSSSEAFVREMLGQHFHIDESLLQIARGEFGKPFLEYHPGVHFNISHAADAIVCAVSDHPVGIDMEKKRKVNMRIMSRFFTETERDFVLADQNDQDERFTQIWTMKEAYVKYTGKGLHQPFDSFDVLTIQGIVTLRHDGYYIAICQETADHTFSIILTI